MKTTVILLTLVALAAAPGVQAECIDLAGQGDACADAGPDGWDIIVDVEQNETGLSLHLESHGVLG